MSYNLSIGTNDDTCLFNFYGAQPLARTINAIQKDQLAETHELPSDDWGYMNPGMGDTGLVGNLFSPCRQNLNVFPKLSVLWHGNSGDFPHFPPLYKTGADGRSAIHQKIKFLRRGPVTHMNVAIEQYDICSFKNGAQPRT